MSPSVPLVEDRLRHAVASLETLHRLASFSSEPHEIALFDDLAVFANTVAGLTRAVRLHVDALTHALPTTCHSIEAPGQDATAMHTPDRTIYLQGPEREIFDRLDRQVPAFRALATALDHYISDMRHADGELLSGMASLIRGQGRATLQVADDIDAVVKQIQEQAAAEQLNAFRRELETRQTAPPAPDEKGGPE